MASGKGEIGGYNPTAGLASGAFSIPSGLSAGDPLFIALCSAGTVALASIPSGWEVIGGAAMGTGGWLVLHRIGGWQTSDGISVTLTFTTTQAITYSTFALDKTLYSPDTFTFGTVTTRTSSSAVNTAASAGTGASDTLVVSFDKASTHAGAPDAPAVSPAVTQVGWRATSAASTPSVYVGIYSGAAASRTITYTTSSGNGAALQIALTAAAGTPSVAKLRGVISGGIEVPAGATLRGVISGGVEVAPPTIKGP